jgi:uncharacterized membrane protein YqjE
VTHESAQDHAATQAGATGQDPSSWSTLGRGVLEEVMSVLRERLRLLALEGQQFAHAAGQLLTLGVIAAVFVLAAWFVLVGGILVLIVQLGAPWPAALAGGAALNLVAALAAWLAMRRQLALMMFPATLRRLQLTRDVPSSGSPGRAAEPASGDLSGQARDATEPLENTPAGADRTLRARP